MKHHHQHQHQHPHSATGSQLQHPNAAAGATPAAPTRSGFSSRAESFSHSSSGVGTESEHHAFYNKAFNLDSQGQWERERDKHQSSLNRFNSSHVALPDGQGRDGMRAHYHLQNSEQNIEHGYEESAMPLTLEGLERRFLEETLKLSKEQYDAEDSENARHKDRLMEINARFHEKVIVLRSNIERQREEALLKETQARMSQYQQMGISKNYQSSGLHEARGYGGVPGEVQRSINAANQYDSYRGRAEFPGRTEGRVSYSDGRGYSDGGGRYY